MLHRIITAYITAAMNPHTSPQDRPLSARAFQSTSTIPQKAARIPATLVTTSFSRNTSGERAMTITGPK